MKLFAFGRGLAAACVLAALPLGAMAASAEEAVALVAPAPTLWDTMWHQAQAPIATVVTAIFGILGALITTKVRQYLGDRASDAVNSVYQKVADQAAGWLLTQLHVSATTVPMPETSGPPKVVVTKPTTTDVNHALGSAVDYAKRSYPELFKKLGIPDAEVGKDILAAAGTILGKSGNPIGSVISGAIGSLIKAKG